MSIFNQRQLQVHIPVVGWLLILGHAFFLAIAAFVFLLLLSTGLLSQDEVALPILTITGGLVALLLIVLAIPGLVAGIALLARKKWGRVLAIVVSILSLVNFPVGTVIGIYALIVLLQDTAVEYFEPPQETS